MGHAHVCVFTGSMNRGNLPRQTADPRMDNQNQPSIAEVAQQDKADARAAGFAAREHRLQVGGNCVDVADLLAQAHYLATTALDARVPAAG